MKKLKIIIFIESSLLALLSYLATSLYFHHENTSNIINKIIYSIVAFINKLILNTKTIFLFISLGFREAFLSVKSFYNELNNAYPTLNSFFNTREQAIIFLSLLFIIILSFEKNIRKSMKKVIQVFFCKQFIIIFFLIIIFIALVIWVLEIINLWNISMFNILFIWFFSVGLIDVYNALDKANGNDYFIKRIKDSLMLTTFSTTFFEFVRNLYSMKLICEFFFMFFIMVIGITVGIIDYVKPNSKDNNAKTKENGKKIILFITAGYLINSTIGLITNYTTLDYYQLLKDLVLPIILTISLNLFNFFLVLYTKYESVFIRLYFKTPDNKKEKKKYKKLLRNTCKLSYRKLNDFHIKHLPYMNKTVDESEFRDMLKEL